MTKINKYKISILLISICLFASVVIWLTFFREPRKNIFGRASMERLLHECTLGEDGLKVGLYRGEPGATDAFWYSVAVSQKGENGIQIFYTYSEPEIMGIECNSDRLNILLSGQDPRSFSLDEISKLKINPKGIYRGRELSE